MGQVHRPGQARDMQARSGQVGRTGLARGKTRGQGQGDTGWEDGREKTRKEKSGRAARISNGN